MLPKENIPVEAVPDSARRQSVSRDLIDKETKMVRSMTCGRNRLFS
jgi:hypothetical protein